MPTAITESEVEVQIPTDKVRAICAYADIEFTRDPVVIAGAVARLRDELNSVNNLLRRSLFMVLSRMPQKWIDDVTELMIARQPKK